MLTTNNPVMEALLDATLSGDNRRLLLVGEKGMKDMIHFSDDGIALLENRLTDAKKRVVDLELAIALSRVGKTLGVKVEEVEGR